MDFLEKDLEDIIFEAMQKDPTLLCERGLHNLPHSPYKVYRQLKLGVYGRADIVSISYNPDYPIIVNIYELKRGELDISSLLQLSKYIAAVKRFAKFANLNILVCGTLIGRSIKQEGEFVFLFDYVCSLLSVYTYDYGINGIEFKRSSGWYVSGEREFDIQSLDIPMRDIVKAGRWRYEL